MVFVFGSNLAGRHGKGAALTALRSHRAKYGIGEGYVGNSYAIPTKDGKLNILHIDEISNYINKFKRFAIEKYNYEFQVTRIGCGLAGFNDSEIAPMFKGSPPNCMFDTKWKEYLGPVYRYWGTM
jgi:hypothetical protein